MKLKFLGIIRLVNFGLVALAVVLMLGAQVMFSSAQDTGEVLYSQDFESGPPENWNLESGWQVIEFEGGHVLAGKGHVWADANIDFWNDYRLSFRVMLEGDAALHANVRFMPPVRYFVGIRREGLNLNKQTGLEDFPELGVHSTGIGDGWHKVEISAESAVITVFVDGVQQLTYTDPEPIELGKFAFESLNDERVLVDDVVITGIAIPAEQDGQVTPGQQGESPQSGQAKLAWVRTGGPLGGLGYDVRMRPDDPNRMYVTDAYAGVFISEDAGETWYPSNKGITTRTGETGDAIPIFSLTIDPSNHDIIWAGTQFNRGIFKTTDGGTTWNMMMNGVTESEGGVTFRGFTIDPHNSDIVYAAAEISSWAWNNGKEKNGREFDMTKGVVYKTTDGGENWSAVWHGENLARYVWIGPRDTGVLYLSTGIFDREAANSDPEKGLPGGEGVLKSTDGGKTWTAVNNGLGNLYVGSLFMHPENPDILLAGTGNNQYNKGCGVYLTTDGGASWKQTLSGQNIESVEFALSDPSIAYAGSSESIYVSRDGGSNWQKVSGLNENGWGAPGVRAGFPIDFQVDPHDPSRIFANNYGGGNFLSLDGGTSWTVASKGYTGGQFRAVAVDPLAPGRVLAAGRSGLFVSYNGGDDWNGLNYPPVPALEWNTVAIDPADNNHVLASNNWNRTIFWSSDGGVNWQPTDTYFEDSLRMSWRVITFAPSDSKIAYAGVGAFYSAGSFDDSIPAKGIYRSDDGGKNWHPVNDELSKDAHVVRLSVDSQNPEHVLAATTNHGVLESQDGGQSWRELCPGVTVKTASSVAFSPGDAKTFFAGFQRAGMFTSNDGGATCKRVSRGLNPEGSFTDVIFDPTNSQTLYAADYKSGAYRSLDGGTTWKIINSGLRMRAINSLAISGDGQHLYAATEGEAVFRLDVNGQPPASEPVPAAFLQEPAAIPQTPAANEASPQTATTQATGSQGSSGLPKMCGSGLIPAIGLLIILIRRRI